MDTSKLLMLPLLILISLVMLSPALAQTTGESGGMIATVTSGQDTAGGTSPELLIRCDDIGMCHSVNLAVEELAKTGIKFSASVMVVCPWFREAASILKKYSNVTVGVHLALNSEWENYKWGPVLGRSAVPSLVDSDGYFFGNTAAFKANGPRTDEVEKELRAQIERAIRSGLDIKYLDAHMSAISDNPEYWAFVKKLAKEYHLVVTRTIGDKDIPIMYSAPIDKKRDVLIEDVSHLSTDNINLLVCHIALDTRESEALIDSNPGGLPDVGKNRQGELDALLSPEFKGAIKKYNLKLVNYADFAPTSGSAGESK